MYLSNSYPFCFFLFGYSSLLYCISFVAHRNRSFVSRCCLNLHLRNTLTSHATTLRSPSHEENRMNKSLQNSSFTLVPPTTIFCFFAPSSFSSKLSSKFTVGQANSQLTSKEIWDRVSNVLTYRFQSLEFSLKRNQQGFAPI